MNKNFNIKTILIAPLDWGLGHATRCIPIIKALLAKDYNIIIATSGKPKNLLQQEFPQLHFVELNGYNIEYSKNKFLLPFKIGLQIPKIVHAIKHENKWLKQFVVENKIDVIISDNRFGFYHKNIPSVFITHQLTIQTPFNWLTKLVQQINYSYINQFNSCWVPDFEGNKNLAGVLSHPKKIPAIPTHYLGLLSRFQNKKENIVQHQVCVLLSGPEPQRTLLENKILTSCSNFNGNIILLRGLPNSSNTIEVPQNCTVYNHLNSEALEKILQQSEYIICRSGYTSLMELLAMQKKCIVIATPGQTEQEYLAALLHQQQWCINFAQQDFNFIESVQKAKTFHYQLPSFEPLALQTIIPQLVEELMH